MEAPGVKPVAFTAQLLRHSHGYGRFEEVGTLSLYHSNILKDQYVCVRVISKAEIPTSDTCGSYYQIGLGTPLQTANKQVANQNRNSILPPLYS